MVQTAFGVCVDEALKKQFGGMCSYFGITASASLISLPERHFEIRIPFGTPALKTAVLN